MATYSSIAVETTAYVTTKKPTGLTITRNGQWFTIKWKIGDDNYGDGQQLQYHLSNQKKGKWTSVSIGKSTTSKSIQIKNTDYYPSKSTKLTKITFRIRGNRQEYTKRISDKHTKHYVCSWSDWATKEIALAAPNKPSLSAQLDDELTNKCRFPWSVNVSSDDKKPYTSIEWQSRLSAQGSNVTDGSKLTWNNTMDGWDSGTSTAASGAIIKTEDTVVLANGSRSRWVRIRARGIAGASDWVYSKHTYARPYQAQISKVEVTKVSSTAYRCAVTWTADSTAAHPIDKTTVQFAKVVPVANMACPAGASWEDANVSKDTQGKDAAVFTIDGQLEADECLFVRVVTEHDSNYTYSQPKLALSGDLAAPTGLSVVTDSTTHQATVTATNASQVPDSRLAVLYRPNKGKSLVVGIIAHGSSSVTVKCPDWDDQSSFGFGVYAFVGSAKSDQLSDGVTAYTITADMKSSTVTDGGDVPKAPTGVDATIIDDTTVRMAWDWNWANAAGAQLSWAEYQNAWTSTEQPETYDVPDLYQSEWDIRNLEIGKTWYIRVRFFTEDAENNITYGPWSDAVEVNLSTAPATPSLYLSTSVIPETGKVTASWSYISEDGTPQEYAEICEATVNGDTITYGEIIAHATTSQQVTISAEEAGWVSGETHSLCVRVTSAAGRMSEGWSDPVAVSIAEPIEAHITNTTLQNTVIVDDEDEGTQRTVLTMTALPIEVGVSGAGSSGVTSLAIERAEDYYMDRPDGKHVDGYAGETIFLHSQTGEDAIGVSVSSLIGSLDDGAQYRLVATVQDGLGQSATDTLEFEVHWAHQAVIPNATVEIDEDNFVAKITPIAPTGTVSGDTCDIYRLSADRPELIVQDAVFGHTYVDPYPALGEFGGHRVVFKTLNGDYITEDNQPAWLDLGEAEGDILDIEYSIIDFDGDQVLLYYNVDLSHSWSKDFIETKYLGGSVQGDWNPAVSRTGSISATAITITDQEMMRKMRRLALHTGICHVRTRDGSSYAADVQVSEDRDHDDYDKIATFAMAVTRVDPEGFEGIPIEMWQEVE